MKNSQCISRLNTMWIQLFCLWDPIYNSSRYLIILICRKLHGNGNVIGFSKCNIQTFSFNLFTFCYIWKRFLCFSHHKNWRYSVMIMAPIKTWKLKGLSVLVCLCVRQEDKRGDEWRWAYCELIYLNWVLTPVSICLQLHWSEQMFLYPYLLSSFFLFLCGLLLYNIQAMCSWHKSKFITF